MISSIIKQGSQLEISSALLKSLEYFICQLCGGSSGSGNTANERRYWLFCQKGQRNEHLPPTSDSLHFHIKRANYQTYIWRKSLTPVTNLPDPSLHGWEKKGEILKPLLMSQSAAPTGLLELVMCSCKKSFCKSNRCSCKFNNLICTEGCACMGNEQCQNPVKHIDDDISEEET